MSKSALFDDDDAVVRDLIATAGTEAQTGQVSVPVADYFKLLSDVKAAEQTAAKRPPQQYVITGIDITGTTEGEVAKFDIVTTVRIPEGAASPSRWLSIQLLKADTLVTSELRRNGLVVDLSKGKMVDSQLFGSCGILGVQNDRYTLFACEAGVYSVRLQVLVPTTPSSMGHSSCVNLRWLPFATQCMLLFSVPQKGSTVHVKPSLNQTLISPSDQPRTTVQCQLPPTNSVEVQWTWEEPEEAPLVPVAAAPPPTPKAAKEKEPEEEKPTVITVEHQTMASIGEGVLTMVCVFNYTITNAGTAVFDVALGDGSQDVRILSVKGGGRMKRYDIMDRAEVDGVRPGKSDVRKPKVMRVVLNYPATGSYTLEYVCEVETGDAHSHVSDIRIPNWSSLGTQRERGYIGVCARTNVEVDQITLAGRAITKIDTRELPERIGQLAGGSILLSYKYLHAAFQLVLRVTKHDDVPVLVAVMDQVSADITYTQEGKILYYISATIRNQSQQYLRMALNKDAEVWTTVVKGQPTKPARDAENNLMIATPKSGDESFSAAVAFLEKGEAMGERGTLHIPLPKFDMTTTSLRVTVYLPEETEYVYHETAGDLDHVKYFSSSTASNISRPYGGLGYQVDTMLYNQNEQIDRYGGEQLELMQDRPRFFAREERGRSSRNRAASIDYSNSNPMFQTQMATNVMYDANISSNISYDMQIQMAPPSPSGRPTDQLLPATLGGGGGGGGGTGAGVIPLAVRPPAVGLRMYFERRIVELNEEAQHIEIPYQRMPRGCMGKCMINCYA